MTKTSSGVYQLPNGMWGFRYAFWVDGKQKDIKRTKDENGNPFKTERAAVKAREAAMIKVHMERTQKPTKKRMTVAEVYAEYCETGRCGKAYGTLRKQDSLWNNHISKRFGSRFVDDISVSEVMDYLNELYYGESRAYKYVEAFLKMFYLIFGQAYSRNYLDVDTYNTLCVNKNTNVHMSARVLWLFAIKKKSTVNHCSNPSHMARLYWWPSFMIARNDWINPISRNFCETIIDKI